MSFPHSPGLTDEEREHLRQHKENLDRQLKRRRRGLYDKFDVRRTDGRDAPGDKHHDCPYLVMDLLHDPHGRVAGRAYADSAEGDGYYAMAMGIRDLIQNIEDTLGEEVTP